MNKIIVLLTIGIALISIMTLSAISNQFVDAGSTKKIHFTQTITSAQDPGIGHESHQLALVLSPNQGTLYDGSMTFSASEPVQIVVLHEINETDAKGQPTWSVDGKTIYGLSLIDLQKKSDSFEFTGAALALHSPNSKEFTATVSVDGWIRGQPPEVIMQKIESKKTEPSLLLSRANVPATIPMHKGLYNGESIYYILTDSSDKEYGQKLSEKQRWKVETASSLSNIPENALQKIFVFTNGVQGDGIYGFQEEIFSSTPSQEAEYSALNLVVEVTWKKGQNMTLLESIDDVINAHKGGRVEFNETGIVLNTPQIIWPDGQMQIRDNNEITDELPYGGGQITEINKDEMTVTFVAHRGWGPDGRTTYCIVTDATPSAPAETMGVIHSTTSSILLSNAADLFQFQNGVKGSGLLGFQPGIASTTPDNENYTPMWKIYVVEWNDPESAKILESTNDIDSFKKDDKITVSIARPMNSEYIVNCPLIDPFQ
ncbi:MAG: hypothetical protein K5793_04900 [Nitrosarchaeum sp.]|nr:hypothetical protein [Nitrosarchaeum sp.]MCV0399431.1 hypothetical protein [Nitrosarchaeum sp.]